VNTITTGIATVIIGIFVAMVAFTTMVLKIIEVARSK